MQPSTELRSLITAWFESVVNGDQTWAERHVSRAAESRLVGTDPTEWLSGEKVAEFLKEEVKMMGGAVKISVADTEAYEEGTVGWGLTRATITMPDGKLVAPRWGAVFHKEGGVWKMVQCHASVGIPNAELFGMDISV